MKWLYTLSGTLLLTCLTAFAGEQTSKLRRGDLIGDHLSELRKYGESKPGLEAPSGLAGTVEMAMWKVGDGFLVIETSMSAGIVKDITYVIYGEKEKQKTVLKVKEVDFKTGEIVLVLPKPTSSGKEEKSPAIGGKQ
jgi:hypothetical protein